MGAYELKENCGVVAISLKNNIEEYPIGGATSFAYRALNSLQHRGQLSVGTLIYNEGRGLKQYKGLGLVSEVFKDSHEEEHKQLLKENTGTKVIGQVRYSTSGSIKGKSRSEIIDESPPFLREHGKRFKEFGIGFNGTIANYPELKHQLENEREYHLKRDVDTEAILHLLAISIGQESDKIGKQNPHLKDVINSATTNLDGAYSVVFLNSLGRLAAFRDPYGFRPLCYGENKNVIAIASESVALIKLGIRQGDIKDVNPGCMIEIDNNSIIESRYADPKKRSNCIFEYVYFADAASKLDGVLVYDVRRALGIELANIEPLKDIINSTYIVTAVPNTSIPVGESMAHSLGIEHRTSMKKSGGRAFIDPTSKRKRTIKEKYTFIPGSLTGKKAIVIDDSIVRGDTITELIGYIKEICGADEVHIRPSCPPIISPCFYGIDFPTKRELVANDYSKEEMEVKLAEKVKADSLRYQTIDALIRSINKPKNELCLACLNGDYPTEFGMKRFKELA